jgi:CYTH domain-containing protein
VASETDTWDCQGVKKMQEIEKKYLLSEGGEYFITDEQLARIGYRNINDLLAETFRGVSMTTSGYLPLEEGRELAEELGFTIDFELGEARLRHKAGRYFFAVKSNGSLERTELEKEVSKEYFERHFGKIDGKVEKSRLKKPFQGYTLEIDVYMDRPLIVAEIEVPTQEEAEKLPVLGKEITEDQRYKNKNLSREKK